MSSSLAPRLAKLIAIFIRYDVPVYCMQGEPGVDYNDSNLNPLVCDLCKMKFKSLDELGEHQKEKHNM